MTVIVKYVGTVNPYFEVGITGRPTKWTPGRTGEVSDADAALLLASGLFEVYADEVLPFVFDLDGNVIGVRRRDGSVYSDATYSAAEIERLAGIPALSGLALLMSQATYPRPFTLGQFNLGEVTQAAATWTSLTASDDGSGKLKLSSAGAHGLATVGRKIPLTFASGLQNGLYTISSIPNSTDLVFTQAYTAVTTPAGVLVGSDATLWTMTVPGNAMGANGVLSVIGSIASTGSTGNKQFKLLHGGTAVVTQTNINAAADVISRIEWRVANMGATNVQQNAVHRLGTASTVAAITGTGAKDTTVDQTLAMTVNLATADQFVNVFGMLVQLAPAN